MAKTESVPSAGARSGEKFEQAGAFGKPLGWQGFTLRVPDSWDLTGFTGNDREGYFRADDGDEQGVEVKWGTHPARSKGEPSMADRAEVYFRSLRQTAKKRRASFEGKTDVAPRGGSMADRTVMGFEWTADRKAFGAIWYCRTCRRVVIAQVLGDRSGRRGLAGLSEKILGTLRCHNHDGSDWWRWSLYDLSVDVPSAWKLSGQQLMNVYLRLTFSQGAARLSVEQWAAANVARENAFLDLWLSANSRAELRETRYKIDESTVAGHRAVRFSGGYAIGRPILQPVKELTNLRIPATRYTGLGWECEPTNKIYCVGAMEIRNRPNVIDQIAARIDCHSKTNGKGA